MTEFLTRFFSPLDKAMAPITEEDKTTYDLNQPRNAVLPDALFPFLGQSVADEKQQLKDMPETMALGTLSGDKGKVIQFPDEWDRFFRNNSESVGNTISEGIKLLPNFKDPKLSELLNNAAWENWHHEIMKKIKHPESEALANSKKIEAIQAFKDYMNKLKSENK